MDQLPSLSFCQLSSNFVCLHLFSINFNCLCLLLPIFVLLRPIFILLAKLDKIPFLRPAIHLSRNSMKCSHVENEKCIMVYFASLFSHFASYFFVCCILHHFGQWVAVLRNVGEGFYSLFFRGIKKPRKLNEIQKVYSECSIFCGVFCENTREIPAKCDKCIASFWPAIRVSRKSMKCVTKCE